MGEFQNIIRDWETWNHVSGKISVFQDIVQEIFQKQGLPLEKIKKMPPSTHAVFRVGNYVIKIYAPREAQMEPEEELRIERFAMQRARQTGVPVPEIVSYGCHHDRYDFFYLISCYIEGKPFPEAAAGMNKLEKIKTADRLRKMLSEMNTPCEPFRQINILTDPDRQVRWQSFEAVFQNDRKKFLEHHCFGEPVFVHGDLNGGNVRIDREGSVWLLDFAEAVPAPVVYEQMYVAVELFQMDAAFLEGYFQGLSLKKVAQLITEGLLIHDFGGDLVCRYFGGSRGLHSIGELEVRVRKKLETCGYPDQVFQGKQG